MSSQKTPRAQVSSQLSFWLSCCVALGALLAPSNLFYSFDQFDWAVRGLRIDYLLPKLYLTDVFLLGIVICGLRADTFKKIGQNWLEKSLLILGVILLARQFFTEFPVAAVAQFLRLSLFILAANVVIKNWSMIRWNWAWLALAVSNLLEGFLSLWQFFTQQSLGSYRTLFGEPNLSQSFGLAHGNFGSWGEQILPYGTTAHPNILAAWLVSSWLLLMVGADKIKLPLVLKVFLLSLTGIEALWGVFVTQSVTALGLLLHGIGYLILTKFWQKINFTPSVQAVKIGFVSLVLCIMISPWLLQWKVAQLPENLATLPSITRRVFLQTTSQTMFLNYPIFGVGINQFTAHLTETAQLKEPVRFDQPVHHVAWLWLTETGLLGLALVISAIWLGHKLNPLFLVTLTTVAWLLYASLVWDHYVLTQPTGLWITWLWWLTVARKRASLASSWTFSWA